MHYYDSLLADLKRHGFRITKLRKAILKELDEAKKPLCATELTGFLNTQGFTPHKTSVYRELSFMLENRIIKKVTFGEKQDRFELSLNEHHHHAVCENCGEVERVYCNEGIMEIERMLEKQDFKVRHHLMEFIGLCKKCR